MTGQPIALTVIGNDRPGIVAAVTRVLFEVGCNLEDVTSTILRGHFSMMMIVQAPDGVTADDLNARLAQVAAELDLVVAARRVEESLAEIAPPTHMVSVYGSDKPGILFRVAELLADMQVNVTDLTSRVIGDPAKPVYALMLEVSVAPGQDLDRAVGSLRDDLGVDVSVHTIDADVL